MAHPEKQGPATIHSGRPYRSARHVLPALSPKDPPKTIDQRVEVSKDARRQRSVLIRTLPTVNRTGPACSGALDTLQNMTPSHENCIASRSSRTFAMPA